MAGGIRSGRAIEVLTRLVSEHGAQTAQIETAFISPGTPWQNGADESFNGQFRDQHVSLQWLRNRADAKVSIETVSPVVRINVAL